MHRQYFQLTILITTHVPFHEQYVLHCLKDVFGMKWVIESITVNKYA